MSLHRSRRRGVALLAVLAAMAFTTATAPPAHAAAGDWPQAGATAAHRRWNQVEATLSKANVSRLQPRWTSGLAVGGPVNEGNGVAEAIVAGGRVFTLSVEGSFDTGYSTRLRASDPTTGGLMCSACWPASARPCRRWSTAGCFVTTTVFGTSADVSTVRALRPSDGTTLWSSPNGTGADTSLAVEGNIVAAAPRPRPGADLHPVPPPRHRWHRAQQHRGRRQRRRGHRRADDQERHDVLRRRRRRHPIAVLRPLPAVGHEERHPHAWVEEPEDLVGTGDTRRHQRGRVPARQDRGLRCSRRPPARSRRRCCRRRPRATSARPSTSLSTPTASTSATSTPTRTRGRSRPSTASPVPGCGRRRSPSAAAPAVANGVLYVAEGRNGVAAYNAATGVELWRRPGVANSAAPVVANGRLYVGWRAGTDDSTPSPVMMFGL